MKNKNIMIGGKIIKIVFAIFLLKSVTAQEFKELNLEDELKLSLNLSTLSSLSILSAPSTEIIIPKCCPFGQNFHGVEGNMTCSVSNQTSESNATDVRLGFGLKPIDGKLCNVGFIIGNLDNETLLISKEGYLLHIETNMALVVYDQYCIERNVSRIIAKICLQHTKPEWVFTDKIIPICMSISVPLLLAIAIIYLIIPKLRNVHGETLALYAVCLGIGYMLMVYDKFASRSEFKGTHSGIQFFMLSSFSWLLMMTVDMGYHVWSYYPSPKQFQRSIVLRITLYAFIAFGVPALIVATLHSDQIIDGKRPENPLVPIMIPISIIIILNFLMFIPIYKYYSKNTQICSIKEEVKYRAKSAAWILTILATNFMFEMVTMLSPSLRLSLIVFPTLNALQGVVMVCVFILMPHYKKIIDEWWSERKYSPADGEDEHQQV